MKKGSTRLDAPFVVGCINSSIHSAHTAHTGVGGGCGFGFLDVAEDALGGQQHTGDAGGVVGRADGTPLHGYRFWNFSRSDCL